MPVSFIKRLRSMNRTDSSGSDLDLDIDLESGGATSEEDAGRILGLSSEHSKNVLGRVRSGLTGCGSLSECMNDEECSCSYDKDTEKLGSFRQNVVNFGHEKVDQEKPKKQNSAKPSKPPRPPRGPALDACDMKLLKEISELKFKRRRMERSRTLKRMKKEKASSPITNLFACLVTIIFLLVIIFQGLLGSRT